MQGGLGGRAGYVVWRMCLGFLRRSCLRAEGGRAVAGWEGTVVALGVVMRGV
jgi:hypothetical protein